MDETRYLNPENPSILKSIKMLPKYWNSKTIGQGITLGILVWATALILYTNGTLLGWSTQDTASWIFSCWFFGSCIGLYLCLRYQIPVCGAWSISGAAVVVTGCQAGLTINQLAVGYLIAGIIVFVIGITGLIDKVMRLLPMPVVMGMTAGCLFKFVSNIVVYLYGWSKDFGTVSSVQCFAIGILSCLSYLLMRKYKDKVKWMPPMLAATLVVIIGTVIFHLYDTTALEGLKWEAPRLVKYDFNGVGNVIVSVSIPLAMLVIGAENTQAVGILRGQGLKPPIKAFTVISGIGGIVTSIFGGHNANIGGPGTAVVASPDGGPLEGRYSSVVISSQFGIIIAVFASIIVPFLNTIPVNLIYLVTGLALVSVILESLQDAFGGKKFQMSAFFAFFVALSQCSFLGIGSAFWSLLIGAIVAAIMEPEDLKELLHTKQA